MPSTDVVALYGALAGDEQDRAIAPAPPGRRKIVLATSIAETSITIEGVRIVVDSGLARVPRYEPDVGVTRLETVRVSRAAADQRRGRAGRTEPGVCYRLWDEPQTAALEPYRAAGNPCRRSVLLRARSRRLGRRAGAARLSRSAAARRRSTEAKALLAELGAIDADGRITDEGRQLAARCRCRRGSRAWWSMPRAAGAGAARRRDRRADRRTRARRRRRRSARAARRAAPRPLARAAATPAPWRERWAGDARDPNGSPHDDEDEN